MMEISSHEIAHQSQNEQIKLATQPVVHEVKRICVLLAGWNEMNTTGFRQATVLRREHTSTSSADNQSGGELPRSNFFGNPVAPYLPGLWEKAAKRKEHQQIIRGLNRTE